ncbi:MAG: ATP-binding protein [Arcobacteraceae bacterium]|nr:ATP-binding protein [Arcobacteraceae bacterium]
MKLSEKLVVSSSIVMIVSIFVIFFNIHNQLTTETKKVEMTRYQHELRDIISKIDSSLTHIKRILKTIGVENNTLNENDIKLKERLEFYLKNNQEIREIKYISLDGENIRTVSTEKLFTKNDTQNYSNELFFKTVLAKDYYISQLYFSPISNDMMVDIATKIIDVKENKMIGILYSKISLNHIQEDLADRLITFYAITIQNLKTKEFLYKSSNAKKFENNIYNLNTNLATIEQNDEAYFMASDSYINSDLKLNIFIFMKEKKIFAQINHTIQNNVYLLLIIILLSSLIISTMVKRILKPLTLLVDSIIIKSNKIDKSFSRNIVLENDEIKNVEHYFNKYIKLLDLEKDKINTLNATLQKRVDEEILKSQKKDFILFEQAKNAQMGEMIGNIAHQWRQPLSVISTSASGILIKKEMGTITDTQEVEMLESIIDKVNYLSQTIDTFRDYIKEKKEFKETILQESLTKDINIIQASLSNHHITLINKINDTKPIQINTLNSELSQVIINLFNNAKDALVEKEVMEPFIKISLEKENDRTIIKIEDNGKGIPQEILPKIFDPYFTTKHQAQGTGLGLYMSKEIIEKHLKGKLYATNTSNGVIFTIELPLVSQ